MVLFTRINLSNAIKATNILDFFYNESSLKEKRGKKKKHNRKKPGLSPESQHYVNILCDT